MNKFLFAAALFFVVPLFAKAQSAICILDFVKIKNKKYSEALYFYEHNWKVYRDVALKSGFIKSYKLLTNDADPTANYDIILITEYPDSVQYKLSETHFQNIINTVSPKGWKLLNGLKPDEFRQTLFFRRMETKFSSDH